MRRVILIEDGQVKAGRRLEELTSLGFPNDAAALAYLRRHKLNARAIASLRSLLGEYSSATGVRLLRDEQVLAQAAHLVVSRRLQLAEKRISPSIRPGVEVQDAQAAKESPPQAAPSRSFIEFQVVEHATGQPVPQVLLTVMLPTGATKDIATDSSGLVHIEDISPGACDVWCGLADLQLSETLVCVAMGASQSSPSAAAKRAPAARRIARIEEHRVKTGESIASLAQKAGLSWQALTKFNWGTAVPKEINEHLRDEVGCAKKTRDGRNYVFDDSDDPGIVLIPSRWVEHGLATGQRHTIRVKFTERFVIILENERGLRIPKADYKASLSDKSVRTGKVGKRGIAVLPDVPPGKIKVEYPDEDDILAKSLAASVRQGFDDRDTHEVFRLLAHGTSVVSKALEAYDTYFNDYTGKGMVEDIYQEFTDPAALAICEALLAYHGLATHTKVDVTVPEENSGEEA
jgi:hypothetical protein